MIVWAPSAYLGLSGGARVVLGDLAQRTPAFCRAPNRVAAVLAARVAGMVDLALAKGPVFGNGDTAGITPREHIEIRHLVSAHRPGTPIFWMKVHKLDALADGGAGRP